MKKRILIANDDGFQAPGIRALASMISDLGEGSICAPDGPRSGFSRAFSAAVPLRLKRQSNLNDVTVWSCSGTPVDCVKLAVDQLYEGKQPDLVLGGINHGDNSTVNSHYSGTMGVAIEGCLKGIPSIAFSLCDHNEQAPMAHLQPYVCHIVQQVLNHGLPKGVCLNVNFPTTPPFQGMRICRMTQGQWVNEVVAARHPAGFPYYWLVGNYQNEEPEAADTDQWALSHGYVAVTPTRIDVTAYEAFSQLETLLL